jgi:hypothetical protein
MYARALLLGTFLAVSSAQALEIAKVGDLEMHCVAVPTSELTTEAAKAYNVDQAPGRGLLTITLLRKSRNGEAKAIPGQVYAGAINQKNHISSIPIRQVQEGNNVYYLGEYRVQAPDTLRFLVNANVQGRMMKAEFSRAFSGAP